MSKISVIGIGYVGLVTGTLLANFGHDVICVDIDKNKINNLSKGIVPIYEAELNELVKQNINYKRLKFTTNIRLAVRSSDVIFIAVGTPSKEDGSTDLQYVLQAAEDVAINMNEYKVIVNKSTVPVGTGLKVKELVKSVLIKRNIKCDFDIVSNPEFLREGSAVYDFTNPDRIVIGGENKKSLNIMKDIYKSLHLNNAPFIETNIETAEMIKYASNSFLAMKITFINEVANLCEKVGANVQEVAKAMGKDSRISPKFLNAGPGYGGSCFPKDTKALAKIAREHGEVISLIEATMNANEYQKIKMVEKIKNAYLNKNELEETSNKENLEEHQVLRGKIFGVLGITFKPRTNDMRESPSLTILSELVKIGAKMKIYDPEGRKEGEWRLESIRDNIEFCDSKYSACEKVDGVIIITEWNEFRDLDLDRLKGIMNDNKFFDLRNMYLREYVTEKGLEYFGVGV